MNQYDEWEGDWEDSYSEKMPPVRQETPIADIETFLRNMSREEAVTTKVELYVDVVNDLTRRAFYRGVIVTGLIIVGVAAFFSLFPG